MLNNFCPNLAKQAIDFAFQEGASDQELFLKKLNNAKKIYDFLSGRTDHFTK
jgi:hypothetical protein